MRSKGGVKPAIPCLTDPVDKLEGLGGKTRLNLLDVRRCVRNIDARAAVPAAAPNVITTGGPCNSLLSFIAMCHVPAFGAMCHVPVIVS